MARVRRVFWTALAGTGILGVLVCSVIFWLSIGRFGLPELSLTEMAVLLSVVLAGMGLLLVGLISVLRAPPPAALPEKRPGDQPPPVLGPCAWSMLWVRRGHRSVETWARRVQELQDRLAHVEQAYASVQAEVQRLTSTLAAGALLWLLAALVERIALTAAPALFAGWTNIRFDSSVGWWLALLASVVAAPFAEETFFRGYVLQKWMASRGRGTALVASSALFAVLHLNPVAVPAIFFTGLALALLTLRTGRLAPAILAHATFNLLSLLTLRGV
ncbi:MAG: CPBP family intramembrane metalloprotease [Chloroflexi bacterium]|nr:CPBP family intramembrane metalloprotease [Chloroflexota bacterium]